MRQEEKEKKKAVDVKFSTISLVSTQKYLIQQLGTMAERLRRKIRNLLGFSRAGSSPAGVVSFL